MTHPSSNSPILSAALVLLALFAAGCSSEVAPEASEGAAAPLDRARAATDELGRRLKAELGAQLGSGGPAAAIEVCSELAPAVTGELSRDGLEIRRTSLRHRNPSNTPDPWERAGLGRLEEAVAAGERPGEIHEVDPATGELRYLRPILVEPACLLCHGAEEELASEVRRRLAERYPEDRATGFAEGDLRGAFSVRVRPAPG